MRYWKFSQKTKLKQKFFFLIVKKKCEIFFKTGTIVTDSYSDFYSDYSDRPLFYSNVSFWSHRYCFVDSALVLTVERIGVKNNYITAFCDEELNFGTVIEAVMKSKLN